VARAKAVTADLLVLSVRTVQKHLERIYSKLGVTSRTAATARVFDLLRTNPT
jgi:DNA-binding NarL/FixJ family response regulator